MSAQTLSTRSGRCQSHRLTAPSASAQIASARPKVHPGWRPGCMFPSPRSGNACVQNH